MKYSIDTSALIDAYVIWYPPDVRLFAGVWEFMDRAVRDEVLGASEEVLHELRKKDDDLHKWAKAKPEMFRATDPAVQLEVQRILAAHPTLANPTASRGRADPFVIALAVVEQCSVVTSEKHGLLHACRALGVPCLSLVAMFRAEGQTF